MARAQCRVVPYYRQFYIENGHPETLFPEDVTDEDVIRRANLGPGIVAVYVCGDDPVLLTIEVFGREPKLRTSQWDHIIECGLDLTTGRLAVSTPVSGPAETLIEVPATHYRVRGYYGRLGHESRVGKRRSLEHYVFRLWPGEMTGLRVIQQWDGVPRGSPG